MHDPLDFIFSLLGSSGRPPNFSNASDILFFFLLTRKMLIGADLTAHTDGCFCIISLIFWLSWG